MNEFNTNQDLLKKFVIHMTGEELLHLICDSRPTPDAPKKISTHYASGVKELSDMIGCCQSTVYALKKQGVLDSAIVSQIGKKIIFDIEQARVLADAYQKAQREERMQVKKFDYNE